MYKVSVLPVAQARPPRSSILRGLFAWQVFRIGSLRHTNLVDRANFEFVALLLPAFAGLGVAPFVAALLGRR